MATIKVKYKGKWMTPDEVAAAKERQRAPVEPPPVDLASLPEKAQLDPDVPLEQLFFEHAEVRAYITKDGKVRSGLTPAQEETAAAILKRYGGQA